MKTLIKKEIRLLLPAWIAAMLLAIVPGWVWHMSWMANASPEDWESYDYLLSFDVPLMFAFGVLCLGVASFGQEFSSNTFAILLSQPAERRRIWAVKSAILAIGSASVWLVAISLVSWQFDFLEGVKHPHFVNLEVSKLETLGFLTVSALAVCSGGLWTTLLLRQIAGAFWVTLLAPVAIVLGIGTVLGFFPLSDQTINAITVVALLCYSIAGFVWARRLFLKAQDTQWTGGNFLFPWRRKSIEQTISFVRVPRNRFAALAWKEIRLHEVSLFIAAALLAVHLAAIVLHPMVSNRNTKMLLELVWSLWLLMPLLIGSAAIADERKLGVLESQHCLPVFRRSQFLIKFIVAFALSVILGAIMPSVIERSRDFGTDWLPYWIFLAATAIFFISFYASTLARSTLHAVGVAIVIPIVAGFGFVIFCHYMFHVRLGYNGYYYNYEGICRFYLMAGLCLLIFPFVLARLTFWNFKWLHLSPIMFRLNLFTILISFALVFALTNIIYFRPWELLAPIESPPGPARLSQETPVKLFLTWDRIVAVLPDGKLWTEDYDDKDVCAGKHSAVEWWTMVPHLHTQALVGNSEGTNVSAGYFFVLAIQPNGSLRALPQFGKKLKSTQIGSATDWRKVGSEGIGFLLLKKNGTLWIWGTNQPSGNGDERAQNLERIKRDEATPPACISDETDWTDIISPTERGGLAEKNDGTFWGWEVEHNQNGTDVFSHLVQNTNWDNQWLNYAFHWQFSAGVKTNGELWFMYQPTTNWDYQGIPAYSKKVQVGLNATWKAVAFSDSGSLIMLRNDGTLWSWKFLKLFNFDWSTFRLQPFHPVQLGNYSDWIALSSGLGGIALAADGGLWNWDGMSDHIWLAPSRKPVYLGNIFNP